MELQPVFEFQVLFEPPPAGIQNQNAELQSLPVQEVLLGEPLPLVFNFNRDTGITIPGEVDELNLVVYPIEIDYLRTARLRAGEGQPAFTNQAIEQAGF